MPYSRKHSYRLASHDWQWTNADSDNAWWSLEEMMSMQPIVQNLIIDLPYPLWISIQFILFIIYKSSLSILWKCNWWRAVTLFNCHKGVWRSVLSHSTFEAAQTQLLEDYLLPLDHVFGAGKVIWRNSWCPPNPPKRLLPSAPLPAALGPSAVFSPHWWGLE